MTLFITEAEAREMLSLADTIPVIEEAFLLAGQGTAECLTPYRAPVEIGHLQLSPAVMSSKKVLGAKFTATFGGRRVGGGVGKRWNFLFSSETGEMLALIQCQHLSNMRTAAATAVAVKYLSPPGAETIGMIGAGHHAGAQLDAICAVRPVKTAYVYSRTRDRREAFCRDAEQRLGIRVVSVDRAQDAVEPADIIGIMTNSADPVLFGEWIKKPVLVVAAGANHWYKREVDPRLVEGARLVVVDDKEAARVESGALLWSVSHGKLSWERVASLGAVVAGGVTAPLREGTMLFFSHGVGLEDVAVSAAVFERAKAAGKGREIDF